VLGFLDRVGDAEPVRCSFGSARRAEVDQMAGDKFVTEVQRFSEITDGAVGVLCEEGDDQCVRIAAPIAPDMAASARASRHGPPDRATRGRERRGRLVTPGWVNTLIAGGEFRLNDVER
jgi:hypothetical protein